MTSPSTANTVRNRISKNEILRGYRAFGHVLSRGTYVQHRGLRLYYDIQREIPPYLCTVGFAVRKPGNSVKRNRFRRWMRESYRQRKHALLAHCSENRIRFRGVFLIDAQRQKDGVSFQTIDSSVATLIASALERLRQA